MDGVENFLLRLLQHLCLLVASQSAPEVVARLFTATAPADAREELEAYIELELTALATTLGKNRDEVAFLLHTLLSRIPDVPTATAFDEAWLASKGGRAEHEQQLLTGWLRPTLAQLEPRLAALRTAIAEDTFGGDNKALQLAYGPLEGDAARWKLLPATHSALPRPLSPGRAASAAEGRERGDGTAACLLLPSMRLCLLSLRILGVGYLAVEPGLRS